MEKEKIDAEKRNTKLAAQLAKKSNQVDELKFCVSQTKDSNLRDSKRKDKVIDVLSNNYRRAKTNAGKVQK